MKAPSCSWLYVDVVWGIQVKNMLCWSFRELGIDQVLRVSWFTKIFTCRGNYEISDFSIFLWNWSRRKVCMTHVSMKSLLFVVAKKSDEKCINASKANQVTWDFGLRQVSNLYRQNKIKVTILVFQNSSIWVIATIFNHNTQLKYNSVFVCTWLEQTVACFCHLMQAFSNEVM